MFDDDGDQRQKFVDKAQKARQERKEQRERQAQAAAHNKSATKIQSWVRRWLAHRCCVALRRRNFDAVFGVGGFGPGEVTEVAARLKPLELFALVELFLRFAGDGSCRGQGNGQAAALTAEDTARLARLVRCILAGVAVTPSPGTTPPSYVALALQQGVSAQWLKQHKRLLVSCLHTAGAVQHRQTPLASLLLNALLTLTESKAWNLVTGDGTEMQQRAKGLALLARNITNHLVSNNLYTNLGRMLSALLCQRKPEVTPSLLGATVTLCLRPMLLTNFKQELVNTFCLEVLAVPTVMHWVCQTCPPLADLLRKHMAERLLQLLGSSTQGTRTVTSHLDGNGAICFLGNVAELIRFDKLDAVPAELLSQYTQVVTGLLDHCQRFARGKRSNMTSEHPLFGLFGGKTPASLLPVLPTVLDQLRTIWQHKHVGLVLGALMALPIAPPLPITEYPRLPPVQRSAFSTFRWRKKSSQFQFVATKPLIRLSSLDASHINAGCHMYTTLMDTLRPSRAEVMGVIAFRKGLVPRLWTALFGFQGDGRATFFRFANKLEASAGASLLHLAAASTADLVTVLEDSEVFDKQEPLSVNLLLEISQFLNELLFKAIWEPLPEATGSPFAGDSGSSRLLLALGQLLGTLHDLDGRRQFAPPDHWVIGELSQKAFDSSLDAERTARQRGDPMPYEKAHYVLSNMPHVVPFLTRVRLFRDEVFRDRVQGEHQKHYVTIRRSAVLSDGFRELSRLPSGAFRGTIKVKFVNQLGVEEAGIDEQGVFKEFLEETIRHAFDPEFGLFTTTPNQQLYPSTTSQIHEQHLQLFEFVGRMLGKACYDGIVVDVPFAHFFLNALVGRLNTLDELSSLDPELAKNLAFVKSYSGNAADLDLVFAVDEEAFGTITTVPLRPGGSALPVTNDNKLLYILLMADYKLNKQLKVPTNAFRKGFYSVIPQSWLYYFAAPEVQRLISGDNVKLDISDLKANVSYLGGLHGSHRVVRWLWECVDEMTPEEQGAFLKFVTSCSKPPILGFSTLRPVFSVRGVQDGESENSYTLGTVVSNFFARGTSTERLPTASTCFNLLKLPLYRSKKVLKEKLRYSINAKAGFELS